MVSPSCKLYALFSSSIISLLLGIATLVLNILFKYIGFVDSDFILGLCTQTYLALKYKYLLLQLQTSFVSICFNILSNIIVLVFIIIIFKNLKSHHNPQNNLQKLPQSVISKSNIIIIYILTSFATLASIITLGHYLTLYFEAIKDPSSCSFSYTNTNLLILMIIAGILLLSMIIQILLSLIVNSCIAEENVKEQKQNKYKDLINITQQPGLPNQYGYNSKPQDNLMVKAVQFTQQPSNGQLHSFGNNKPFMGKPYQSKQREYENKQFKKPQPFILKDMDSSQMFKAGNDTPTNFGGISNQQRNQFLNYGDGGKTGNNQAYRINTNETLNSKRFYSRQNEQPERKVISGIPITNNNYNSNTSSGESPSKSPGKFYSSNNNPNLFPNSYEEENVRSINSKPYQNQPLYNNPFSKPLSPIKQLNESVFDNPKGYTPSPIKDDPFRNVEMYTANGKNQPQRVLNTGKSRDNLRLDTQEDNTGAQLMFQMKPSDEQKPPIRLYGPYKTDNHRFEKNSSGQVSFKSPSRFDSKFAQQESKYLSRNAPNSILPALNKIKQSETYRKNNDNYSSGGINSYFAQSRGRQSVGSPGGKVSKTKAREGVLTSFIRGKFV